MCVMSSLGVTLNCLHVWLRFSSSEMLLSAKGLSSTMAGFVSSEEIWGCSEDAGDWNPFSMSQKSSAISASHLL